MEDLVRQAVRQAYMSDLEADLSVEEVRRLGDPAHHHRDGFHQSEELERFRHTRAIPSSHGWAATFNQVAGNAILSGEDRTFDIPTGSDTVEIWACGVPPLQLAFDYDLWISGAFEHIVIDSV